jgi:hypothetical protein
LTKEFSMSVRASLAAVALVVGTVFVVGCAQTSSPTSPSSSASSPTSPSSSASSAVPAGSFLAAATSETSHTLPPDEVFTDINPCTGDPTEVTFHYLQFVAHFTEDGAGGLHSATSGVLEVTTDDGFSGRGQVRTRFSGPASDVSQEAFGLSVTLGNGTGQRIVVHIVAHLVIVDGVPIVDLEIESIECQGKP